MSNETLRHFTKKLDERARLKAKLDELEAIIKQIDLELKTLDKQDDPYIFGTHKVFWKTTTKTSLDQKSLKEHNPAAYEKALVTKTTEYFAIR